MQQFCWGQSWIIVQKSKNAIGRPAQPSSFLVLIMEVIICSVVVKGFVTALSIYSVLWVCFLFVKCWRQLTVGKTALIVFVLKSARSHWVPDFALFPLLFSLYLPLVFRKLAGCTLFITGASRGIGKAIALKAARDGANIVIAAKTAEPHPKLPGTIYTAAQESKL